MKYRIPKLPREETCRVYDVNEPFAHHLPQIQASTSGHPDQITGLLATICTPTNTPCHSLLPVRIPSSALTLPSPTPLPSLRLPNRSFLNQTPNLLPDPRLLHPSLLRRLLGNISNIKLFDRLEPSPGENFLPPSMLFSVFQLLLFELELLDFPLCGRQWLAAALALCFCYCRANRGLINPNEIHPLEQFLLGGRNRPYIRYGYAAHAGLADQ